MHQQQPDAGVIQPRHVQSLIGRLRLEAAVWANMPAADRRRDYADGIAIACDALEYLLRDAYELARQPR